jgi:hypothetical protein
MKPLFYLMVFSSSILSEDPRHNTSWIAQVCIMPTSAAFEVLHAVIGGAPICGQYTTGGRIKINGNIGLSASWQTPEIRWIKRGASNHGLPLVNGEKPLDGEVKSQENLRLTHSLKSCCHYACLNCLAGTSKKVI